MQVGMRIEWVFFCLFWHVSVAKTIRKRRAETRAQDVRSVGLVLHLVSFPITAFARMSHVAQTYVEGLQGPLSHELIDLGKGCETDDDEEDELTLANDSLMLLGTELLLHKDRDGDCDMSGSKTRSEEKAKRSEAKKSSKMQKTSAVITDSSEEEDEGDEKEDDEDLSEAKHKEPECVTFDNCEAQDEADDESQRMLEEVLFATQDQIKWVGRITKNVYRVQVAGSGNGCLKIQRKSKSRNSVKPPMELRVLSFLAQLPPIASSHVQRLTHCFLGKHTFGYVAKFMPALTDLPDVLQWNTRPAHIVSVMQDVLRGLHLLHSHGIIHRDIKPSNVFWDETHAVLGDFGLATWSTPKGHFSCVGTRGYMAPELLAWSRDMFDAPQRYDSKCDLYSAGMLFGALLFSMKEKHVDEHHAPLFRNNTPKFFEPHIWKTVQALLERNPAKRPTALEALHMLDATRYV